MFCKYCGKQIPDGNTACEECKAKLEAPAEQTAPIVEEAPVEEAAASAVEAPVAEEAPAEEVAFEEPVFEETPKAKKKVKKGLIFGIVGGVLAVVAAAVVLFFVSPFVKGHFIKMFGSEAEYFAFVEKQAMEPYIDTVTTSYGTGLENLTGAKGAEVKAELKLNEEAIPEELLSEIKANLPENLDGIDLNSLSVAVKYMIKDKLASAGVKLDVNANTLLNLDAVVDMESYNVYLGLPELAAKYVMFELADELDGSYEEISALINQLDMSEIAAVLPDEATLNKIVNKYIDIALENVGSVTESSKKFEVEGISQKLTILKKKVTEKDLLKMCKAILKELKSDKDIKDIINSLEEFIVEKYGEEMDMSEGEAYDTFKDGVDDALDSLEEVEASGEELFVLIDYVNANHEIVGRALEIEDETIVEFVSVKKGKNTAFRLEVESAKFMISGEGTEDKDVVTGSYDIILDEEEILTIGLTDFDFASLKAGKLNGSITLTPNMDYIEDTVEDAGADLGIAGSFLSLVEPAVKLTFVTGDTEASVAFAVLCNKTELASLTLSAKTVEAADVTIPSDAVDGADPDALYEWINSIDTNKLADALKGIGLPEEFNNYIDELAAEVSNAGGLANLIEDLMYGGSYDDSYDDYYDDDYYGGYYDEPAVGTYDHWLEYYSDFYTYDEYLAQVAAGYIR